MQIVLQLNEETSGILEKLASVNALDVSRVAFGLMQVGIDCLGVGYDATFLYNSEREDIAQSIFEDAVRHHVYSDHPLIAEQAHSTRHGAGPDGDMGDRRLCWKS